MGCKCRFVVVGILVSGVELEGFFIHAPFPHDTNGDNSFHTYRPRTWLVGQDGGQTTQIWFNLTDQQNLICQNDAFQEQEHENQRFLCSSMLHSLDEPPMPSSRKAPPHPYSGFCPTTTCLSSLSVFVHPNPKKKKAKNKRNQKVKLTSHTADASPASSSPPSPWPAAH